jgi:hypothetical protein
VTITGGGSGRPSRSLGWVPTVAVG